MAQRNAGNATSVPETANTPDRLRIGMVAPPWYDLPPSGYGGIEAMVYWLVQELVERGHDVTVVSAGEDQTHARSRRTFPDAPSTRVGEALPEVIHAAVAQGHLTGLELDLVHDHSLGRHCLQRDPGRRLPVPGRQGGLLPVSRPHQPREGAGPRDPRGAGRGPPDRAGRQVL
ncbi:MAG TPA: glycosyltransferase [Actinomycetota bacterium]|nr:glycosyltransferase [Actinomycetota bacterium]